MNKKKILVMGIVLLWIFVFGCLGGILKKYDGELLDADKQHMIGASYMTMNNEFYNIVSEEIIQRVEAEGDQWVQNNLKRFIVNVLQQWYSCCRTFLM